MTEESRPGRALGAWYHFIHNWGNRKMNASHGKLGQRNMRCWAIRMYTEDLLKYAWFSHTTIPYNACYYKDYGHLM